MTNDHCDLLCLDAPRAEGIREKLLEEETARGAAERARALADPTRLTLAAALREGGEFCVCDLAWISERSQNLVSHHLRVLRSHGLVRSRRDGKLVMYSLTDAGRSLLSAVLEESAGVSRDAEVRA
ncbi:metalloregulator ArsR/SmtB family transcription factor (plasmid) [Rubrobacter marinus]|uniref:Metalloregulator ArsR/SmtB family transcription factor n=1 Tax=Rubrobacter marinus TaxID=2653852 RepID=A0A6G8Q3M7_9ACTN|nr:metalloregulator ArsR/SmtB family transcription factor [Rubrobacter marinus]QIN81055.1 metalloregulator ArsR/SmtB family transcription factor [Rubrobacter marinus]